MNNRHSNICEQIGHLKRTFSLLLTKKHCQWIILEQTGRGNVMDVMFAIFIPEIPQKIFNAITTPSYFARMYHNCCSTKIIKSREVHDI